MSAATIKFVLDKESADRAQVRFDRALKTSSNDALGELVSYGVSVMRKLEQAANHEYMARLWTGRPIEVPDGVGAEIYSKAEDRTFYSRS